MIGTERDQWRAEFVSALLDALPEQHRPEAAALVAAVGTVTKEWSVSKNTKHFRDANGRVQDGTRLHGDPGDESKHEDVVFFEILTAERSLNDAEREARERHQSRLGWLYGPNRYEGPPPADVRMWQLLEQRKWWRTADGQVLRLKEMEPSHRVNVLRMLWRQAESLHREYTWSTFGGAPFDVQAEAEAEDPWEWVREQPLYRRLAKLVKKDAANIST